jgi:hypothetical protein
MSHQRCTLADETNQRQLNYAVFHRVKHNLEKELKRNFNKLLEKIKLGINKSQTFVG